VYTIPLLLKNTKEDTRCQKPSHAFFNTLHLLYRNVVHKNVICAVVIALLLLDLKHITYHHLLQLTNFHLEIVKLKCHTHMGKKRKPMNLFLHD